MKMEDRRHHHKSKSSRKHDRHHHKHRSSSKRDHSRHKREHSEESKTPPLPSIATDSEIADLLKKRENLKDELRKMTKRSESFPINSKNDKSHDSRKRHSSDKRPEKSRAEIKTKQDIIEIKDDTIKVRTPVDSDDEEKIIEQRRKQRKLLLEKLVVKDSQDEDSDVNGKSDLEIVEIETHKTILANNIKVHVEEPQAAKKDVGDMFSEKDDFLVNKDKSGQLAELPKANVVDNFDDEEGYYKARVGDTLHDSRYIIKSVLGQGMFANVIKAHDKARSNIEVAIKIARNNDMMYKNALKEVLVLTEVNNADPDNKAHCVRFLRHFMHKGHLCIVLESLGMDLRSIVRKYGKNCGLSMQAVISYSKQLLLALRHLKKVGYIHADIKPDNILVSESKTVLKLCDFGSAEKVNNNDMRPYLVSRFYRAPEIILGVPYGFGIDVWSAACTIYELATGKIMFTGNSNNKMLKYFMDVKGKIPNKLIKKGKFKDQHFNYKNNFLLHCTDTATGREKIVEMVNVPISRNIMHELKKTHQNISNYDEKKLVLLKDLLDKMLTLDPSQRMTASECLKHPFIIEEYKKQ